MQMMLNDEFMNGKIIIYLKFYDYKTSLINLNKIIEIK